MIRINCLPFLPSAQTILNYYKRFSCQLFQQNLLLNIYMLLNFCKPSFAPSNKICVLVPNNTLRLDLLSEGQNQDRNENHCLVWCKAGYSLRDTCQVTRLGKNLPSICPSSSKWYTLRATPKV